MSIEIDVLNGDASWPRVKPLMDAVWPDHIVAKLSWGHIKWAHADLRVLIEAADGSGKDSPACHVGIYFRTIIRRATRGTNPLRGDGAVRVRHFPRPARRRYRPMRPAMVTPARRRVACAAAAR